MVIEELWEIARIVAGIAGIIVEASLLAWYLAPFMMKKRRVIYPAIVYFFSMMLLYLIPYPMPAVVVYAIGCTAVCAVTIAVERSNIPQKVFLSATFYLLEWIAGEVALFPWHFVSRFTYMNEKFTGPGLLFQLYVMNLIIHIMIRTALFLAEIFVVGKVFTRKDERMGWSELAFLFTPCAAVVAGYWIASFMSDAYAQASGDYIWSSYPTYHGIRVLFGLIAFGAVISVIISYQKFKESQEEVLLNTLAAQQIDELSDHVHSMEKVYADIRSARHDINDHIMVLGNLLEKKENEEALDYLREWHTGFPMPQLDVRTGNPVTDIVLSERKREAEDAGIDFMVDFHYPDDASIQAFDVGVILNNSISNALTAASGMDHPKVQVRSWMNRRAFLIEIRNSFDGQLNPEKESKYPETSKPDKEKHGYGLSNMKRITEKYFGTIELEQEDETVIFTAMMIV